MRARLRKNYQRHPWLAALTLAYVGLVGVELARSIAFEPRTQPDSGFHGWERVVDDDDGSFDYRWTTGEGLMRRAVAGRVLRIDLLQSHPRMPPGGTPVAVRLNGTPIDEVVFGDNGRRSRAYYLPAVLGAAAWETIERAAAPAPRPSSGLQELTSWSRPPVAAALDIRIVSPQTFVPAALLDSDDARRLGVGVAEVGWLETVPAPGIGLYAAETNAAGEAFQWTNRWASRPETAAGTRGALVVWAHHPDIGDRPVSVTLLWGPHSLANVRLYDANPTRIEFELGANAPRSDVFSVHVDRTWNPLALGVAPDDRDLGVGISPIDWR